MIISIAFMLYYYVWRYTIIEHVCEVPFHATDISHLSLHFSLKEIRANCKYLWVPLHQDVMPFGKINEGKNIHHEQPIYIWYNK